MSVITRIFTTVGLFFVLSGSLVGQDGSIESELRRRGAFGARLGSVTRDVQERQGLSTGNGIVIEQVIPGTSAADAELMAGDVIQRIDRVEVASVAAFLEKLAQSRSGDVLVLAVVRDGVRLEKRVTLKEMSRENDEQYDTTYGHVISHGVRLRSIVTRPKVAGSSPAVLLLQGYGNFSIDQPIGPPTNFTRIARHLARHGYVTMRIDRRGSGDSEGTPSRDMDFETELDGYRQALSTLRKFDFVDKGNVFIFGHSLGGFTGPILAAETPVRGIASYGTIAGTWFEGILAQRRQFASLDGTSPAEVEKRMQREMRFWYPLLVDKQTPAEIRQRYPELSDLVARFAIDDTYVFDRPYSWLHQVVDKNMGEVWAKVASTPLQVDGQEPVYPRVLSIWGTSDWVAEKKPIAWITEIVNRSRPGNGTFIALDSTDHLFFRAASREESFGYFQPTNDGPFGEFNPAILTTLRSWLDETSGIAEQS